MDACSSLILDGLTLDKLWYRKEDNVAVIANLGRGMMHSCHITLSLKWTGTCILQFN